jgi:anti-anti-sigma regulatory factor
MVGPDQTVVRLVGDVDLRMAGEFAKLVETLPSATAELVLDVSALTFCDASLAGFLAVMVGEMPVTISGPNRWVRAFLGLVGVADRVRIVEDGIQSAEDAAGFAVTH